MKSEGKDKEEKGREQELTGEELAKRIYLEKTCSTWDLFTDSWSWQRLLSSYYVWTLFLRWIYKMIRAAIKILLLFLACLFIGLWLRNAYVYPASRGYIFAVWAGVRKVASADNRSIFHSIPRKFAESNSIARACFIFPLTTLMTSINCS